MKWGVLELAGSRRGGESRLSSTGGTGLNRSSPSATEGMGAIVLLVWKMRRDGGSGAV